MNNREPAQQTRKGNALTGGFILITLGVLIILHKMNVWGFSASWPVLLIVIALGTLLRRVKDVGGWIIAGVGIVFLIAENLDLKIYAIATFLLPLVLILAGINVLMKHFKKNDGEPQ